MEINDSINEELISREARGYYGRKGPRLVWTLSLPRAIAASPHLGILKVKDNLHNSMAFMPRVLVPSIHPVAYCQFNSSKYSSKI